MKTFSLKTLTFASFAAVGMTCCTTADKTQTKDIHYTFNDLDSVVVASLEDIGIAFDTIDMGRTSQMLMPNEHTIAFRDSRCQHQVKIVDLNTGRVHQLVNVGQGPELKHITDHTRKKSRKKSEKIIKKKMSAAGGGGGG
ncbi:MAG: hypothetical protein K2F78_02100, partial [Muribaculaceae bacterium]|nr:hypothetical protein [Muribaculaceae bacterium]